MSIVHHNATEINNLFMNNPKTIPRRFDRIPLQSCNAPRYSVMWRTSPLCDARHRRCASPTQRRYFPLGYRDQQNLVTVRFPLQMIGPPDGFHR